MSTSQPTISDLSFFEDLIPGGPKLVKTTHKATYPAISPLRPELNQAGRTILITGASAGIGFAIARAFAEASAARIILTGRRPGTLQDAAFKLSAEFKNTEFVTKVCDVGNEKASEVLWSDFHAQGIFIDVLVLNAAKFGGQGAILKDGLVDIWSQYETNVRSLLDFSERLYKQEGYADKQKYIVYVSTAAIHDRIIANTLPSYSLTKTSGHLLLQRVADGVDRSKLQIVSFHPGSILSETTRNAGLDESTLPWDNDNLPANFAVWAATPEAALLHGRFVWAAWDVDELLSVELKERLETDPYFLTIGLVGV